MRVAFTAVAGLEVIGRGDAHRRGRLLVPGAPAERFQPRDGTAVILLQPNLPERLQGGQGRGGLAGCRQPAPIQELIAVRPDLAGERLALARVLRQARLVGAETIAGHTTAAAPAAAPRWEPPRSAG